MLFYHIVAMICGIIEVLRSSDYSSNLKSWKVSYKITSWNSPLLLNEINNYELSLAWLLFSTDKNYTYIHRIRLVNRNWTICLNNVNLKEYWNLEFMYNKCYIVPEAETLQEKFVPSLSKIPLKLRTLLPSRSCQYPFKVMRLRWNTNFNEGLQKHH